MRAILAVLVFSLAFAVFNDIKLVSDRKSEDFYIYNFIVKKKVVSWIKYSVEGEMLEQKGVIPDGIAKEYSEDRKVLLEIPYKNNQIDGIYKEFYKDGTLKKVVRYKAGKKEGISKEYYDTGEILYKWNYKNDVLDGKAYEYDDDNGKIIKTMLFNAGEQIELKPFAEKVFR